MMLAVVKMTRSLHALGNTAAGSHWYYLALWKRF